MIRRVAATLSLALVSLLMAGCWSRVEVNDLAIVSMMAVDRTEEGDLQIWVHVDVPGRAGAAPAVLGTGGGGGGGGGGIPFLTLTAHGKTVLEAAKFIQLRLPRRLFWAHMRVILVGERLAREGLRPALDFLTRHPQLRLANYLLVLRGSVPDLMASPVDLDHLPGEYLRKISRSRIGTVVTLGDFSRMLEAKGADPVLGVVRVVPPPSGAPPGQKRSLELAGTALFRKDKLVQYLSERETRGLLWLRAENQRGTVTVELPGVTGSVTMEWWSSRVRRSVRVENGRITVYIRARLEGDISDDQASVDLSDPEVIAEVEKQINDDVRRRMEEALEKLREQNVDGAGFGELVHQHLPAVWNQIQSRWLRQEFQRTNVVLEVDAKVRRTGLSSKPRGVPEERLKKGAK